MLKNESRNRADIVEVRGSIEKQFITRFRLRGGRYVNRDYLVFDRLDQIVPSVMDHRSLYRWIDYRIVVAQPYTDAIDDEDMAKLEAKKITVVDCEPWSWYYPGFARCYALICSPAVIWHMKNPGPQHVDHTETIFR